MQWRLRYLPEELQENKSIRNACKLAEFKTDFEKKKKRK